MISSSRQEFQKQSDTKTTQISFYEVINESGKSNMKWLLLAAVSVALGATIANAVQDKAFKERAEIYSSEFLILKILFE